MVIGYSLFGYSTDTRVLGDHLEYAPPDPCKCFKSLYEINFLPNNCKLPGIRRDFYGSLDGFRFVSENVVKFCKKNGYENIEFVPLPGSNYYWFKPRQILKLDKRSKRLLFNDYNKKCRGYREIVCYGPLFLSRKTPIDDNFFITDISFGYEAKSPFICVGVKTFEKLKRAKLTGFIFEEIRDKYDKKDLPDLAFLKKVDDPNYNFEDILDD